MTMNLNSSARRFRDFAIRSKSKVSSMIYYPAINGLVEVFNKTMGKLIKKFISKSRHDWDEKLCECLWAYRMTVRIPMKAIPFSWCRDAKPYSHWKFKFQLCELPWQSRWQMRRSIDCTSRSWKFWTTKIYKLKNKSSSIKLEFLAPSTRKSRSEFSRMVTLS